MVEDEGSKLKDFVALTVNQIKEGIPEGFKLNSEIEFDLSVVSIGETKGKLDLRVIQAGKGSTKEETQRIKFKVGKHIVPTMY